MYPQNRRTISVSEGSVSIGHDYIRTGGWGSRKGNGPAGIPIRRVGPLLPLILRTLAPPRYYGVYDIGHLLTYRSRSILNSELLGSQLVKGNA